MFNSHINTQGLTKSLKLCTIEILIKVGIHCTIHHYYDKTKAKEN